MIYKCKRCGNIYKDVDEAALHIIEDHKENIPKRIVKNNIDSIFYIFEKKADLQKSIKNGNNKLPIIRDKDNKKTPSAQKKERERSNSISHNHITASVNNLKFKDNKLFYGAFKYEGKIKAAINHLSFDGIIYVNGNVRVLLNTKTMTFRFTHDSDYRRVLSLAMANYWINNYHYSVHSSLKSAFFDSLFDSIISEEILSSFSLFSQKCEDLLNHEQRKERNSIKKTNEYINRHVFKDEDGYVPKNFIIYNAVDTNRRRH